MYLNNQVCRGLCGMFFSSILVAGLWGCSDDKTSTEATKDSPAQEAAATLAPVKGDEPLPSGHPPIEDQSPGYEADHGMHPKDDMHNEAYGNDDAPLHPQTSGKKLVIELPEEVKGHWAAVELSVISAQGEPKKIRVPLNEPVALENTGLAVKVSAFVPTYTSDFEKITSVSNNLDNPAVMLHLMKDEQEVTSGWVFMNLPEFNTFKSEEVTISLVSAEPANKGDAQSE